MNKKIFVTGGAGYIGSHVCLELLRKNYDIMVFDDFSNSSIESLRRVELIANRKLKLIVGDIRHETALNEAIFSFNPDIVIHFAGLKAVEQSVKDPVLYYDVNIHGSLNLLKAITKIDCNKIIFSSSATVYGDVSAPPFKETYPVSPISPYGRSKLFFEDILSDWVKVSNSRRAVILRYFNPVGADQSGMIGEDPLGMPNNLMPHIVRAARDNDSRVSIFGSDYDTRDGTGERDYIHVSDLAHGHLKAAENIDNLSNFQKLNLGTGHSITVKELISAFEASNDLIVPTRMVARRPGDVAKSYADPSLAKDLLGFECRNDIRKMCIDTWRWVQENPNGYR